MPEFRHDPIDNRWVIIAESRAARPGAFTTSVGWAVPTIPTEQTHAPVGTAHPTCPFCPGNERETPPEVFALRAGDSKANSPGWRVRVVPNKYPALAMELAPVPAQEAPSLFSSFPAIGVHEVIIDTPRHLGTIAELTDGEFTESWFAIRSRLHALRELASLKHALVFKNVGRASGASIEHVHSQLMATQTITPLVAEELRGAKNYFDAHSQCAFCQMIEAERSAGARLVAESLGFIALCPYASRFAYETWVLPRRHQSHFEATGDGDLADLASFSRGIIGKIERLCQPPAYNLILHTSPFDTTALDHYHWHIEVIPRLTISGGFEWGSGCFANPVSPENAAAVLRS
jgi:UDPglucose--hexose-1-phosphate uridylyltransferase